MGNIICIVYKVINHKLSAQCNIIHTYSYAKRQSSYIGMMHTYIWFHDRKVITGLYAYQPATLVLVC